MKVSLKNFPRSFWMVNGIVLVEKVAYTAIMAIFSIYLTNSVLEGGLGFSHEQRGTMQGICMSLMYFLPVIVGSFADRYGYKITLIIAFSLRAFGCYLLGTLTSYYEIFFAFLIFSIGVSASKPVITGTITKVTDIKTSALGFGIFYMMINTGAFIGPWVGGSLRSYSGSAVFYLGSIAIALLIILAIFFYHEPIVNENSGKDHFIKHLGRDIYTVATNYSFILFILIMSLFFTILPQLYFTLPLYIKDFTNTTPLLISINSLVNFIGLDSLSAQLTHMIQSGKQVKPEYIISLGAASIILLQFIISSIIKKYSALTSIILGLVITLIGLLMFTLGSNPWLCILALIIFSIGEMTATPRFFEYFGTVAPKNKVALYMGCSHLPAALGNFMGGFLSGFLYMRYADPTMQNSKPYIIWITFAGIICVAIVGLILYNKYIVFKKEEENNIGLVTEEYES